MAAKSKISEQKFNSDKQAVSLTFWSSLMLSVQRPLALLASQFKMQHNVVKFLNIHRFNPVPAATDSQRMTPNSTSSRNQKFKCLLSTDKMNHFHVTVELQHCFWSS